MNYPKLSRGEESYLTKMEVYNASPSGVDLKTNSHLANYPFPISFYVQPTGYGEVLFGADIVPMWKDLAVLLEEKNQNDPNYDNEDKIRTVYFFSTDKTAIVDKTYKLQEAYRILLTFDTSSLGLSVGDLIDIGVPQGFPYIGEYYYYDAGTYLWTFEMFGTPMQFKVIDTNKAIAVCDITIDNHGATNIPDAREQYVAEDYGYWNLVEREHGDSSYYSNYKMESPFYLPKRINQDLASTLEALKMLHQAFWYRDNEVRIGTNGAPNISPTWNNVRIYEGKTRTEILTALSGMSGVTNIDSLEIVYNNEGDTDAQKAEVRSAVRTFVNQQSGICKVLLYEQTYSEYTEGNTDYQKCVGFKEISGWAGTNWQTLYDYWQAHTEMGELPKNVVTRRTSSTSVSTMAYLPSQGMYVTLPAYANRTNTASRPHT